MIKHVGTVVNSINNFPLAVAKALSNLHKNPRPPVDCYRKNHQHLLVQTNIQFLVKLVINMTLQHHISQIQFF